MGSIAARFSRKALASTFTSNHIFCRTLATESAAKITESPDRVKWDYRGQRQIIPLGRWLPKIAIDAYVAPNVVLAGQVTVCGGASVWNGSVFRGDLNKITVGFCSNVQERFIAASQLNLHFRKHINAKGWHHWSAFHTHGRFIGRDPFHPRSWVCGSPWEEDPHRRALGREPIRFIRTLSHEETLEIPKLSVTISDMRKSYFLEFLPYSTVYLEVEKMKKSLGISI